MWFWSEEDSVCVHAMISCMNVCIELTIITMSERGTREGNCVSILIYILYLISRYIATRKY